ncbi:hypothetical protein C8F04DRAFT_1397625 [Mycena alexandri]|uniref:3-carboxymuconate cyclase n=1 Tax=Mycena alexandri TaxID=1745969 RepID=A0AAD6WX79_9AGAR|nr:hypothetical protein C8F04DRAFT_1397625 [Mycena alexandri]
MKSFTLFTLASVASTVLASTTPTERISMAPKGFNSDSTVGAAYFMTNEASGNYLVSSSIGSDGKLTLYEAVYTGGNGTRALTPFDTDPLFSQGSVGVSQAGRFVTNVNAGSNTVSVHAIDIFNPAQLWPIGKPVSSGGDFPNSLVINKAGNRVCVVNAGAVNGVRGVACLMRGHHSFNYYFHSCYKFNWSHGLTPIPNSIRSLQLNQTTPVNGSASTPSQIIFSADEKQLIVSVKTGYLAIWDINADGSLSSTFNTVSGGAIPFSITPIPGQNALLVSDPGVGYDIFNLNGTKAKAATISVPVAGQVAICWSTYRPESGNFYLIDVETSIISEVDIAKSLNSTIQYPLGTDGPLDTVVATVGKNDFMYTLAAKATGLTVLSVGGPGKLTVLQRIDLVAPAKAAKLAINGTNVQGMTTFIGW